MGNELKRWIARVLAPVLVCVAGMGGAHAGLITYDFESLPDGTRLADQYAGLHFTNATAAQAGVSLNEFAFPPHSGTGAVYDDGGTLAIAFDRPVTAVSGYFTYQQGLTLFAYDSAGTLLDTVTSTWLANTAGGFGDPGSLANELLALDAGADAIARIVIEGAPEGFSFVLDDLAVSTGAIAVPVPEPGSGLLVLTGLLIAAACGGRRTPPPNR